MEQFPETRHEAEGLGGITETASGPSSTAGLLPNSTFFLWLSKQFGSRFSLHNYIPRRKTNPLNKTHLTGTP